MTDDPVAARTRIRTASLWLAIGMLVVAALLGAYFIIIGDQAGVAGRAWLTLLLVALFAGAVLLDTTVGDGPNTWYLPTSIGVNVVLVAIGLLKLWNGWGQPADTVDAFVWTGQMFAFFAVVVLLRLALLVTQLWGLYFVTRAKHQATRITAVVTIVLVWATALILAAPAAFPEPAWPDWWWRAAGATALVAVVTLVIPLIVRAFEPKAPKPAPAPAYGAPPAGYPQQGYAQPGYPQSPQPGYGAVPPVAPQPPAAYPPAPPYGAPVPQQPAAPAAPPAAPPAAAPAAPPAGPPVAPPAGPPVAPPPPQ